MNKGGSLGNSRPIYSVSPKLLQLLFAVPGRWEIPEGPCKLFMSIWVCEAGKSPLKPERWSDVEEQHRAHKNPHAVSPQPPISLPPSLLQRTYIFTFLLSSRVFIPPHDLLARLGQICLEQRQQLEAGPEKVWAI